MNFDYNPDTCALVEEQLIREGAVDRIADVAREEVGGQFGSDLTDGFGALSLCLRAGCVIFCDTAVAQAKKKGRDVSLGLVWLSALSIVPVMSKSILSTEIKKRKDVK